MSYATTAELASALRIQRVTPEMELQLQACLDAAVVEIDHYADRGVSSDDPPVPVEPEPELLPLYNRVNVLRGVEWWKANDAAFGVIGFDQTGSLLAPRDGFARHGRTLIPAKVRFGVA